MFVVTRFVTRAMLTLGISLALLTYPANAQEPPETPVKMIIQNSLDFPVDIYWAKVEGVEIVSESQYVNQLQPGYEIEQLSFASHVWRVKRGNDVICEYDASGEAIQSVDLAALVAWQTEVEVVFQNTTSGPVSLFFVDADAQEVAYQSDLQPGMEIAQPSLPGNHWRIRQNDRIVAEYVVNGTSSQVVDLKVLSDSYTPMVEVAFQNTTPALVNVHWVDADNQELVYAPDLPSGSQFRQAAYPFQLWRIRSAGGELLAEVYLGDAAQQSIDLTKLIESYQQQLAGGTGVSGSTPANGQGAPKPPKPNRDQ